MGKVNNFSVPRLLGLLGKRAFYDRFKARNLQ